jgi:hypothetical protein
MVEVEVSCDAMRDGGVAGCRGGAGVVWRHGRPVLGSCGVVYVDADRI